MNCKALSSLLFFLSTSSCSEHPPCLLHAASQSAAFSHAGVLNVSALKPGMLPLGGEERPSLPGAGAVTAPGGFLQASPLILRLLTQLVIEHGSNWRRVNSVVKVSFFTMLRTKQTFIANICENTSLRRLAGIPVLYCWQQEQQNKEIPVVRFFVSENNIETRFNAQCNTFTFLSQEEIVAKCCRWGFCAAGLHLHPGYFWTGGTNLC